MFNTLIQKFPSQSLNFPFSLTKKENSFVLSRLLNYINNLSPVSIYENTYQDRDSHIFSIRIHKNILALKIPHLDGGFKFNERTTRKIFQSLKMSFWLIAWTILLAFLWGITWGAIMGINCDHPFWKKFISFFLEFNLAIPSFVLGIFAANLFSFYLIDHIHLDILSDTEKNDFTKITLFGIGDIVLPALVLSILPGNIIAQLTGINIRRTLDQPYIITAKAKGLSNIKIIGNHVVKNILGFLIRDTACCIYPIMLNAFFIEYIFRWKGIGWLTIISIYQHRWDLVICSILVMSILYLSFQLIKETGLSLLKYNEFFYSLGIKWQ